jgi:hypothetical protein
MENTKLSETELQREIVKGLRQLGFHGLEFTLTLQRVPCTYAHCPRLGSS